MSVRRTDAASFPHSPQTWAWRVVLLLDLSFISGLQRVTEGGSKWQRQFPFQHQQSDHKAIALGFCPECVVQSRMDATGMAQRACSMMVIKKGMSIMGEAEWVIWNSSYGISRSPHDRYNIWNTVKDTVIALYGNRWCLCLWWAQHRLAGSVCPRSETMCVKYTFIYII